MWYSKHRLETRVSWKKHCWSHSLGKCRIVSQWIGWWSRRSKDNIEGIRSTRSLDRVKNCIEVHGDNEMNKMLNDLTGRVVKLKLKTLRQTNITSFLKKWNCKDMIYRTLMIKS